MDWTTEMTAYMHENAQLQSAAQIAKHLGVSRSAVLGKARREGKCLAKPMATRTALALQSFKKNPNYSTIIGNFSHGRRHLIKAQQEPFKPRRKRVRIMEQQTEEFKCTIYGLTEETCKWPLWGDEPTTSATRFYCGCHAPHGSYCDFHHEKAGRPWARALPTRPSYRPSHSR